jgi:hypothetical protein
MKIKALGIALLLGGASLCASASPYLYRVMIPGLKPGPGASVATIQIAALNGAGAYADGTYATSCLGYLHSSGSYSYSGYTGSGTYWLKPAASSAPFQAYCDMSADGGGWTLVGTFNGTTDTTLPLTQRTTIAYTQAKISLNGVSTTKVISCYPSPQTGFAPDNSGALNCTIPDVDGNTYAIRVDQVAYYPSGNYGFYTGAPGALGDEGGCYWDSDATYVWGRTWDGYDCTGYGTGELANDPAGSWSSSLDWLLVR